MTHIRKMLALGATLVGFWTTSSAQLIVNDPVSMGTSIANTFKEVLEARNNLKQLKQVYDHGKHALEELEKVHTFVKDAYKAKECLSANLDIVGYYSKDFGAMMRDPNFSPEELAKISRSYQKILKQSTETLKKLEAIVKPLKSSERGMRISDAERMELIESTYQEMIRHRKAALALSKLSLELSFRRAQKDGKDAVKRFYALYGRASDRW